MPTPWRRATSTASWSPSTRPSAARKPRLLADRLRDINPEIELTVVSRYIKDEETDLLLDAAKYDYAVDAIDTLSPKLALIKGALDRSLPLVSSMGAGAKTDPTKMEIADISKTHHCPLAHMLRKRLHKIGVRSGFQAVYSPEPMREGALILCEEQNKKSNVGTISYIPALFGIGCASVRNPRPDRRNELKPHILMKPNIVFLDEYTLGGADLGRLQALGEYKGYARPRRKSFPTAAAKPT